MFNQDKLGKHAPMRAVANTAIIGADFHRAMVATVPGEKLLKGRRPVRNWTRSTISSLFLLDNCICSQENQQKLLPTELLFLTETCNKSFVDWGFAPDPTGGAYSAPPDLLAVFRGPTYKGRTAKGRGERLA